MLSLTMNKVFILASAPVTGTQGSVESLNPGVAAPGALTVKGVGNKGNLLSGNYTLSPLGITQKSEHHGISVLAQLVSEPGSIILPLSGLVPVDRLLPRSNRKNSAHRAHNNARTLTAISA